MKKFNVTLIALLIAVVFVLSTVFAACTPGEPSDSNKLPDKDVCNHSLTRVAAVKETCTTEGNLQYWFCSKCGKYFADGNAANEIDKNDATIAAHHTLTHESERKATCTTDGNVDYFHCSVCGDNFLDENGKNKVDLDDTVIASKGHVVGGQWEHDENGHWKICSACGQQVDYHAHNFEDYVCTDCGAIDEANRPLTEEEIVQYVTSNFQEKVVDALGGSKLVQLKNIFAIDFFENENLHNLRLLVDYHTTRAGIESDFICLLEVPMATEMNKETIRSAQYAPKKNASTTKIININRNSDDNRGVEILKKIDPDGDHDHYDFVSVAIGSGPILSSLGPTNTIKIYTINNKKASVVFINAQSMGVDDIIKDNILNGELNKTFQIDEAFNDEYLFSDKVIYNFGGLL